jgi:hypothetical protein
MMHHALDKFVDELMIGFEEQRRPRLAELSDLLTKTRQDFLGSCLQHPIEGKYAAEFRLEKSTCPNCDKVCYKICKFSKNIGTMQGLSELRRPWFYCSSCGQGFTPFDAMVGQGDRRLHASNRVLHPQYHLRPCVRPLQASMPILFSKTFEALK